MPRFGVDPGGRFVALSLCGTSFPLLKFGLPALAQLVEHLQFAFGRGQRVARTFHSGSGQLLAFAKPFDFQAKRRRVALAFAQPIQVNRPGGGGPQPNLLPFAFCGQRLPAQTHVALVGKVCGQCRATLVALAAAQRQQRFQPKRESRHGWPVARRANRTSASLASATSERSSTRCCKNVHSASCKAMA